MTKDQFLLLEKPSFSEKAVNIHTIKLSPGCIVQPACPPTYNPPESYVWTSSVCRCTLKQHSVAAEVAGTSN